MMIKSKLQELASGPMAQKTQNLLQKSTEVTKQGLEKGLDLTKKTLDVATRTDIDEHVREHILLQSRYNDALASKLQEALDRIEALEKKLGL